jgi:adenosine deaminase
VSHRALARNNAHPRAVALSIDGSEATAGRPGWDDEALRAIARTSIDASFADASLKAQMRQQLARW